MKFLQPIQKQTGKAKICFFGFPKSGKTYTASHMAVGLAKQIGTKKPIAFVDTEGGVDYVAPIFKKAKLEVVTARTRAFADHLQIFKEAEQNCDILIFDSVTHSWEDTIDSYKAKKKTQFLAFHDWGIIKPTFNQLANRILACDMHVILCIRAGWEWDYIENPDTGKMEVHKVGTKMRMEAQFGYEPSLLIEMERVRDDRTMIHRAWILGDRSDILDGKCFDNPSYQDFKPHFDILLEGESTHSPVDLSRTSQDMFEDETGKPEWKQKRIQKEIDLEEIQAFLVELWPSTSAADKAAKANMLEVIFGSRSWKYVEEQVYPSILSAKRDQLKILRDNYGTWSQEETDLAKLWEKAGKVYDVRQEEQPDGQQELGV